jgi:arylsulfatase A-like enzyme
VEQVFAAYASIFLVARRLIVNPVEQGMKTMKHYHGLSLVVAGLLSFAAPTVTGGAEPPRDRPNILLIFVDDLGYGELGCQGNAEIPTPHIDSLASSGVRCTSGYVTASYCSPSRAGLLTGRYQTRFGHELNPVGKHNLDPRAGLPLSEVTIADRLREAGYATGLVGKWHLGGTDEYHPQSRGFHEFFGFLHEGHFFVPPPYRGVTSFLRIKSLPPGFGARKIEGDVIWSTHLPSDEPPYDADNPILRGSEPLEEPAYLTDALTREAVSFIDRHKSQPFFLYLAYNAVHSPMQGAKKYMDRFAHIEDIHRRVFAAMLANLDDSIGTVLAKLRAEGLDERTLIFFISDNGGPTAELTSSNRPLRGGKGDLYEGGIRVPFIVRWKGKLPSGRVYSQPVITTDVFATACAAAGVTLPNDRTMDGVNLLPHLSGENRQTPHEVMYWRMDQKAALRSGNWKIVRQPPRGAAQVNWQLYNLANDISETSDLAEREHEKLASLVSRWQQINGEMVEPVWRPNR